MLTRLIPDPGDTTVSPSSSLTLCRKDVDQVLPQAAYFSETHDDGSVSVTMYLARDGYNSSACFRSGSVNGGTKY